MLASLCAWAVAIAVLGYLAPHCFVAWFFKTRDLRKRYDARWAAVTGASSGIGKALARRLASQGLSVVLVALGDGLLEPAAAELREAYPGVEVRAVAADLGRPGYVDVVAAATADIDVQAVFLNAGYMTTGFFDAHPLERHLANVECNAVAAMALAHLFLGRLLAKRLRGCLVFTSSAAAAIPSPFSVTYAATKAFVSSFGASLAAEVRAEGVDVLVVHPSPVASRFYDKAHALGALNFFQRLAVDPEELPDVVFASIGRLVWRDVGPTAVAFRLLMKLLDFNLFSMIVAWSAPWMGDYKEHAAGRRGGAAAAAAAGGSKAAKKAN